MTDANKTHLTIVLDESGSMLECQAATEEGFNAFIAEQRKVPGECLVTLVRFNTRYRIDFADRPLAEVPRLQMHPGGGTALLDAIGKAINETGTKLAALPEHARPGAVVVVIQTDGEENSSVRFTLRQIHDMITRQTDQYQWRFIFLGANQDAIQSGQSLGVPMASSITYDTASAGPAFETIGATVGAYRGMVASGMSSSTATAATGITTSQRATAMGKPVDDDEDDEGQPTTP